MRLSGLTQTCIRLLSSRVLDGAREGPAAPARLAEMTFKAAMEPWSKLAGHSYAALAQQAPSGTAQSSSLPPAAAALAADPLQGSRADRPLPLYDLNKQQVGECVLPGDLFNVPVRVDILHQVVKWQRAKARQGTHSSKTRAEVRGGGRKPHPQKGSGRARAGTIRAPHWRKGGIAHGPKPRSHAFDLNRKVRRLGLLSALSAKASEGRLMVVDTLKVEPPKTAVLDRHLDSLLAGAPRRSVLFVDSDKTGEDGGPSVRRAASNLPWVDVLPELGLNVYSILQRDQLVLSKPALEAAVERLRRPIIIRRT